MTIAEAIAAARKRFDRSAWLGYHGNGWRSDLRGWRRIVMLTKRLHEK